MYSTNVLKRTYRDMPEDRLLYIAKNEYADLSPEGKKVLQEELQLREINDMMSILTLQEAQHETVTREREDSEYGPLLSLFLITFVLISLSIKLFVIPSYEGSLEYLVREPLIDALILFVRVPFRLMLLTAVVCWLFSKRFQNKRKVSLLIDRASLLVLSWCILLRIILLIVIIM